MRRTKSKVMNKALKIAYLNILLLGLNIPIKLNEMLSDAFVVILRLHGSFEASFLHSYFWQ